jgi:predicted nuclease with TOPRIM domain
LKINCTKKGQNIENVDLKLTHKNFKHALIFFQGLESLEGLVQEDEQADVQAKDVHRFFDY